MYRATAKTVALFILLVLACAAGIACGGIEAARDAGERAAGDNKGNAQEPAGPTPGPEGTAAGVPEATTGAGGTAPAGGGRTMAMGEGTTVQAGQVLEDKYYQDSDGNAIPDFVEAEEGYDPERDDCVMEGGCGSVAADVGERSVTDEQNTLLILDSSGSMAEQDPSGVTKMEAARDALERYVVGTPDSFNLGLMVYGHEGSNAEADRAESCEGIETFAPLGDLEVDNAPSTLERFRPTGWTPVAGSLRAAAGEFKGKEGAVNRVILVTDGIETCGGDPVAAARALKESGVAVTVDVVGFDVENASEQEALRKVAEATGGDYVDVRTASELNDHFGDVVARRWDIAMAQLCLRSQSGGATTCVRFLSGGAITKLRSELAYETDERREEAIEELVERIRADAEEYERQIEAATGPRIEELQREFDETQERYRERYGEEVSRSGPCAGPSVVFARTGRTDPRPAPPASVATVPLLGGRGYGLVVGAR